MRDIAEINPCPDVFVPRFYLGKQSNMAIFNLTKLKVFDVWRVQRQTGGLYSALAMTSRAFVGLATS